MKSIDIVTSALNEKDCLPELFTRLRTVINSETAYIFRLIIIDNGSTDGTWEIIKSQTKPDLNVIALRMSRTFDLDAAFTCGIDHATADALILMTSDLQDPPEVIHSLLREYENGSEQVLVRITSRKTVPITRRILSKAYYWLMNNLTDGMIPKSVSDFRLLSRDVYENVRELRESHRFMRGISSWVGFKCSYIEIARPPRYAGESKWLGKSLVSVLSTASRSIFAFSIKPLILLSAIGSILSVFSIIALSASVIGWLLVGVPFAGFGVIVSLAILGFSITILALGVIAQYLGLIYEEVKKRPIYIIAERISSSDC
jgi:glycosyltransferase involved in cell wall biosynthesis